MIEKKRVLRVHLVFRLTPSPLLTSKRDGV